MTEYDKDRLTSIEEKVAYVEEWVQGISQENVEHIDRGILRDVLEHFGADFEALEEPEIRKSLGKYTNKGRYEAMKAIWGEEAYSDFKKWAEGWIEQYEEDHDVRLPALKKSGIKISGMKHMLGEMTALAGLTKDEFSSKDYKRYTKSRVRNGRLWIEGNKDQRDRVQLPTAENPKLLASVPPEAPVGVFEYLKQGNMLEN